jgi:epoxyqueuosine reductase
MSGSADKSISGKIKDLALNLGFDLCGIAKARPLDERRDILDVWCLTGMNAGMNYMARNTERRIDPSLHLEDAKSVIVTGLSYYTNNTQKNPGVPVISRYAFGTDYHVVIEEKLGKLLTFIKSISPDADGKYFVDSTPFLEKGWACEAGLGWQGKHSIVINKDIGSFFFIGILILNIGLEYDNPLKKDYCGNCTLCIDRCPTGAINSNKTVDARKCIANLTIENRGPIPEEIIPKLGNRIYGCDLCQEVCPWNRELKNTKTREFDLPEIIRDMTQEDWLNLTEEQFNSLFDKSPVARRKYMPFMKNIETVVKSSH